MYEPKVYRGIMCHENEELCKIWRGIHLSIQNLDEEFDKVLPEHSKISKILDFNGLLLTKVCKIEPM